MKMRSRIAAVCGALALAAIPVAAVAGDTVISVEGVGSMVIETHEVCATAFGATVCYTYKTYRFEREQQREVTSCDGPCTYG